MTKVIKNLDTIIAKCINRPSLKGVDVPLYARVLEYSAQSATERAELESEDFKKAIEGNYSSPTNIRRLFITGNGVYIQTYKPFIRDGKPDKRGCWYSYKFDEEDKLLSKFHDLIKSPQDRYSEYMMEKAMNPSLKEPDTYIIKGMGLRALSKPYVISNIEEVYFDKTLLLSEEIRNTFPDASKLLLVATSGNRGKINNDLPLKLFESANGENIQSLRKRYPRLKSIGLISELEAVMTAGEHSRGVRGELTPGESTAFWCNENAVTIAKYGELVIINRVTDGISALNTKFEVRDGVYKFDRDILVPFIDTFNKSALELARKARDKKLGKESVEYADETSGQNEPSGKNELEQLLDEIDTNSGVWDAKIVLLLTLSGLKKSEYDMVVGELTAEGTKKYMV